MSDVHCPICLVLTSNDANLNTEHDNSKQLEMGKSYHVENKVICGWSFTNNIHCLDIEDIVNLLNKLTLNL